MIRRLSIVLITLVVGALTAAAPATAAAPVHTNGILHCC
jgi:hypothetical protein